MGTTFSILRKTPQERYTLGSARLGYPDGIEVPPKPSLLRSVMTDGLDAMRAWMEASTRWSQPGWAAMWDIMTPDGDYRLFRLDDRPIDELAGLLHMACTVDGIDQARIIAEDLKEWAGTSDLILSMDGEMKTLAQFGFENDEDAYPETGSVRNALRAE